MPRVRDEGWWENALCREVDGELFFAEGPGNTLDPARRVCALCPVRVACLADELQHDDQASGIFGGFGRLARQRLRARVARGNDRRLVAMGAIYMDMQRAS